MFPTTVLWYYVYVVKCREIPFDQLSIITHNHYSRQSYSTFLSDRRVSGRLAVRNELLDRVRHLDVGFRLRKESLSYLGLGSSCESNVKKGEGRGGGVGLRIQSVPSYCKVRIQRDWLSVYNHAIPRYHNGERDRGNSLSQACFFKTGCRGKAKPMPNPACQLVCHIPGTAARGSFPPLSFSFAYCPTEPRFGWG